MTNTQCGFEFLRFYPKCLQKFANPKCYVILYALLGMLWHTITSYFTGTLSTIQKNFQMSSQNLGKLAILWAHISVKNFPQTFSFSSHFYRLRIRWNHIEPIFNVLRIEKASNSFGFFRYVPDRCSLLPESITSLHERYGIRNEKIHQGVQ